MRRRLVALTAAVLVLAVAGPVASAPADRLPGPDLAADDPWGRYDDPAWSVERGVLDAAVDCLGDFGATVRGVEPVVLVHGTGTAGHEQYQWNWEPRLAAEGIPYCVVTYPQRGSGDQQISAEYVARAVQIASERSVAAGGSGEVDLMGHSQGASMPRWAIKHWESVQDVVDDAVLHAGPHHGTIVAGTASGEYGIQLPRPPAFWQFARDSRFVAHLNAGRETPGAIDYTSIYAVTDELVQPSIGELATARLDGATNIDVQAPDACPLRPVEHLTIGTVDGFVMALTLDAFAHDGPGEERTASLARVFAADPFACALPFHGSLPVTGSSPGFGPDQFAGSVGAEPATAPYAHDFVDFEDR